MFNIWSKTLTSNVQILRNCTLDSQQVKQQEVMFINQTKQKTCIGVRGNHWETKTKLQMYLANQRIYKWLHAPANWLFSAYIAKVLPLL